MTTLTPHLDAVCAGARDAPVRGVDGVCAVWIGGSVVTLPDEWTRQDPAAVTSVAAVHAAWRQFWTRPFRAFDNRDGRHLVFWHAGRLQLGPDTPTGLRMHRRTVAGEPVVIDVTQAPIELCRGMLGTRARALMEAGMRTCLLSQLRKHGLPTVVPRPFLDALGFRIEAQMDARLDWTLGSDELSALLLGSAALDDLLRAVHPEDLRFPRWRSAAMAVRAVAAHWPVEEHAFLPFAVPMAQHGTHAASPSDVAYWLHTHGVSRAAISRLHRLPFAATGRLASLMLDLRPQAVRCVAGAMNRWLAHVAVHAADGATECDLRDAMAWLALDAGQDMLALPATQQALTARILETDAQDILPWPDSGRAEYAIKRGFRPKPHTLSPRRAEEHGRAQRYHRTYGRHVTVRTGSLRRGHLTVTDLLHGRTAADTRTVRHFAARMTALYLAGRHREEAFGNAIAETCDWFGRARPVPGLAQIRGDWDTLQQRQHRWHDHEHVRSTERRPPDDVVAWDARVGTLELAPWRAVELNSNVALWHEGDNQQHCVFSYAAQCVNGDSVIFSLRIDGSEESHGTAQFRRNGSAWQIVQLRGKRNAAFPTEETPARDVLRALVARIEHALDAAEVKQKRAARRGG